MRRSGLRFLALWFRGVYGARFLSWIFRRMSFALPVHRLRETTTLIAFRHPASTHPFHVLLVPKKAIAAVSALDPLADAAFLADVFRVAQSLVDEFHLAEEGYRLIVNGGRYQKFPYLHFHLISDGDARRSAPLP